jgi:UDP-2,3-diacylglucosamine hydrolase
MPKPDYIVSDTHLGAVPDDTERAFVRFLDHAGAHAATLVVNGDLFDFWFEWGPVIPARHYRVLAAMRSVIDAGVPVTMIGGNHDAWGGRFLTQDIGMTLHNGLLRTTLGGKKALVAHGDGLGKGDFKYRLLKAVLRSRAAVWGFRALHPEIGIKIANYVSSTEDKAHDDRASSNRAAFLEHWATEQLAADAQLQLIACGHSHVPVVVEMGAGRYYVNSGDWVRHRSYVTLSDGSPPMLREWRPEPGV